MRRMGEKFVLPVCGETRLADGTHIRVRKVNPLHVGRASATALHEARHAVTAERNGTSVLYATVVPGNGSLGLTALSSFDATAAAAPHAYGDGGTSADVLMIQEAGHSVESAGAAARSILASREAQLMVDAVATALDRHGTVGGNDIRGIMEQAKGGNVLEIIIIRPNGMREVQAGMRARMDDETVAVPIDTRSPEERYGEAANGGTGQRRKKIPASISTTPKTLSRVTVPPRKSTE